MSAFSPAFARLGRTETAKWDVASAKVGPNFDAEIPDEDYAIAFKGGRGSANVFCFVCFLLNILRVEET